MLSESVSGTGTILRVFPVSRGQNRSVSLHIRIGYRMPELPFLPVGNNLPPTAEKPWQSVHFIIQTQVDKITMGTPLHHRCLFLTAACQIISAPNCQMSGSHRPSRPADTGYPWTARIYCRRLFPQHFLLSPFPFSRQARKTRNFLPDSLKKTCRHQIRMKRIFIIWTGKYSCPSIQAPRLFSPPFCPAFYQDQGIWLLQHRFHPISSSAILSVNPLSHRL